MRRLAIFAATLALATPVAAGDDADPLRGLSGARAKEIATDLASDAMEGRKTGFPSGERAEERVAALYREAGLRPGGEDGGWFHAFGLSTSHVDPPIALSIGGERVEYGTGFVDLIHTGEGLVEAEVVFVGYGIATPDRGWDDYEGVDVTGKVVLALRGVPASRDGDFGDERMIGWKSRLARERGAAGFLIVEGKNPLAGTIQERFHEAALPAVWVSEAVADRMLLPRERRVADLKRSRDAGDPGRSFATSTVVSLEVHGRLVPNARGRNVLARVDGADESLAGEAVLVGAHLDHLGVDPLGRVFNGADDNASGSASVLHLAETLVRNGWRPRRTVFFCGFAGEEQGLLGSRALAKAMPFSREVVAMVNVDMTGQGKPTVALAGVEGWPKTAALLRERLGAEEWGRFGRGRAEPNSDHWCFLERGVPALFAMTEGDHPNYHRLEDDAPNLKPECLEAAARAVGRLVVALADEPRPLRGAEGLPERVLREGSRVVEGERSAAVLARLLAGEDGAREEAARSGWSAVAVPVDERGDGPVVAISRLAHAARARKDRIVLASTATDLANAARAGRVALLPRLSCPDSARAFPGVLASYRALGYRWIAPFSPSTPPAPEHLDAVVDEAVAARVLLDVTGLPPDLLRRVRARLKDAPAVLRLPGVSPASPEGAAALREARIALGAPGLVLLDPSPALFAAAAAGEADPPASAAIATTGEDADALRALLSDALRAAGPGAREPDHTARARLRSLVGGAWLDLLRKLR